MARRIFKANLSVDSIRNMKKELMDYQNNTLPSLIKRFVEELAKIGIQTARANLGSIDDLGNVSSLVSFTKEVNSQNDGYVGLVIAKDLAQIKQFWLSGGKVKSADVSPLLMYEFGSGQKASNPKSLPGVGQGTFPGQTHAFDKEGWYWQDLNGKWHHSYGITPTSPMFHAFEEIERQVANVAKEVFG